MAYIPNAQDPSEPTESRTVESAALEFRTLKTEHVRGLRFPVQDTPDNRGELPSANLRKGAVLAFNLTTGKPEVGPLVGDIADAANNASIATAAAAQASIDAQAASDAAVTAMSAANTAAEDVIEIISNLSSALDYGLIVNTPTNIVDYGELA